MKKLYTTLLLLLLTSLPVTAQIWPASELYESWHIALEDADHIQELWAQTTSRWDIARPPSAINVSPIYEEFPFYEEEINIITDGIYIFTNTVLVLTNITRLVDLRVWSNAIGAITYEGVTLYPQEKRNHSILSMMDEIWIQLTSDDKELGMLNWFLDEGYADGGTFDDYLSRYADGQYPSTFPTLTPISVWYTNNIGVLGKGMVHTNIFRFIDGVDGDDRPSPFFTIWPTQDQDIVIGTAYAKNDISITGYGASMDGLYHFSYPLSYWSSGDWVSFDGNPYFITYYAPWWYIRSLSGSYILSSKSISGIWDELIGSYWVPNTNIVVAYESSTSWHWNDGEYFIPMVAGEPILIGVWITNLNPNAVSYVEATSVGLAGQIINLEVTGFAQSTPVSNAWDFNGDSGYYESSTGVSNTTESIDVVVDGGPIDMESLFLIITNMTITNAVMMELSNSVSLQVFYPAPFKQYISATRFSNIDAPMRLLMLDERYQYMKNANWTLYGCTPDDTSTNSVGFDVDQGTWYWHGYGWDEVATNEVHVDLTPRWPQAFVHTSNADPTFTNNFDTEPLVQSAISTHQINFNQGDVIIDSEARTNWFYTVEVRISSVSVEVENLTALDPLNFDIKLTSRNGHTYAQDIKSGTITGGINQRTTVSGLSVTFIDYASGGVGSENSVEGSVYLQNETGDCILRSVVTNITSFIGFDESYIYAERHLGNIIGGGPKNGIGIYPNTNIEYRIWENYTGDREVYFRPVNINPIHKSSVASNSDTVWSVEFTPSMSGLTTNEKWQSFFDLGISSGPLEISSTTLLGTGIPYFEESGFDLKVWGISDAAVVVKWDVIGGPLVDFDD